MPGTTSDQNVIAVQMLGTSPMAAAVPGFIGGAVVLILNIVMMNIISKKEIAKGHVYDVAPNAPKRPEGQKTPHWLLSIIPIAVTLICFNGLGWNILVSMMLNIILSLIFFFPYYGKFSGLKELIKPVGEQTTMLVLQVGLLGAIGGVVAASPAFPVLTNGIIKHGWSGIIQGSTCNRITDWCIRIRSCRSVRYITVHVRDIRKHGYQHECSAPCIRICISDT